MEALTLALFLVAGADLDAGELLIETQAVPGSGLPRITAQGVIDAPPDKVWAVIEDCSKYAGTMPRVKAAKALERDAGTMICETTIAAPFPVGDLTSRTRVTLTVEPGVRWERRWALISGDYTANEGAWVLTPYPGTRTLARYELHADPKAKVPNVFIASGQKGSMNDLFARVRALSVSR